MPIRCFTIQVRADKLVESVWLEGDEIPLVSDTEFSKLSPENASVYPLAEPAQNQLFGLIRDYLLHLGTVELRGDSFYPLRPGQAPAGQGGRFWRLLQRHLLRRLRPRRQGRPGRRQDGSGRPAARPGPGHAGAAEKDNPPKK